MNVFYMGEKCLRVVSEPVEAIDDNIRLLVEENLNISNTVNIPRKDGKVVIEVQLAGNIDTALLKKKFEEHAIELAEITHTSAKAL